MKYRTHLQALFILLTACIAAGAQTVTGSFEEDSVTKGATLKGTIILSLPAELHANSNKPNSEYAIPTVVRLTAPGLKIGEVQYPEGKNKKFQFSDTELNVYDGDTSFPFTVTVPRRFRGGSISVKALVRYQACTDEICYPPANKEIVLTATVK